MLKKKKKKVVPSVNPVFRATQRSQVEHETSGVFTVHPLGWMPGTFLAPSILCQNGDIQLHRDILGLSWILAPYIKSRL